MPLHDTLAKTIGQYFFWLVRDETTAREFVDATDMAAIEAAEWLKRDAERQIPERVFAGYFVRNTLGTEGHIFSDYQVALEFQRERPENYETPVTVYW